MLAIGEAHFDCHLAGSATADQSQRILDRLLDGLKRELPAALSRAELDGSGLVHIDQLAMTARIDLDWPDSVIARSVASSLLDSIEAALDAPGTVRFIDQADRLARFLVDLADGAAFTKGWHEVFAGLRLLPASAIVRTLAQLDSATMLVALGRLSLAQRRRTVALMAATDAQRTLAELRRVPGQAARDPAAIAHVLGTLGDAPFAGAVAEDAAAALVFLGTLHAHCGRVADQETFNIAAALLATEPPETTAAPDDRRGTLDRETANAQTYDSPHGGVWLLLPELIALGLSGCQSLIVLALCAGPDSMGVRDDRALRDALGIPPDEDPPPDLSWHGLPEPAVIASRRDLAYLRKASARLGVPSRARTHRLAIAAVRRYARRLPGFADSSLAHLWVNLLAAPARVVVEPGRLSVLLSPPPLVVVWRLSGADRADYWLADRRSVSVRGAG